MITFEEFTALDGEDQDQEIYTAAALVGERDTDTYHIKLWQLHNFYVEVFTDIDNGSPIKNEAFTDLERLNPYIDVINIG